MCVCMHLKCVCVSVCVRVCVWMFVCMYMIAIELRFYIILLLPKENWRIGSAYHIGL